VTAPSRSVGSTLEQIRSEPQFQQIRTLIRSNPQLLSQFIQQLQIENPEAFAAISANQQEFINMINEPGDAPAGDDSAEAAEPANPGDGPRVRQTEVPQIIPFDILKIDSGRTGDARNYSRRSSLDRTTEGARIP
jgi:hypothetical protein